MALSWARAVLLVSILQVPANCQVVKTSGGGYFHTVGFESQYYPIGGYQGTRVLEHNQTGRYASYVEVSWSQAAAIDGLGQIWMVDKQYHQVILVAPSSQYFDWPSYYYDYAGQRGTPGHRDGSRKLALFDSPMGLAVGNEGSKPVIFVADTNNHVIRRLEFANGRTTTIVGRPKREGLVDGKGLESRFKFPMSLGVDIGLESLFVLDNGKKLRYVDLRTTPPTVFTLVGGACRMALGTESVIRYGTIIARTVACHPDWLAADAGEEVGITEEDVKCMGHISTCAPRVFPALGDKHSKYLVQPPEELLAKVLEIPRIIAAMKSKG